MVFQQFNLFPHLSILDNCTLAPIWVKKMPKKEAQELALDQLNEAASLQLIDLGDKNSPKRSLGRKILSGSLEVLNFSYLAYLYF